ncbi:hypothetical protein SPRG_14279 [Saprolegnia parasitica CBS 223.65]|uniref:CSN8/PSMD8/EIF3K domain-containing protein n=1 Tax=Saprolegnia parasitica (strain CBS 223.65) TaxID=695850 RepID=A0A067C1S6_SAPPC|nr:hypothetical protein SPRG_14279 [Saprolegnia parasitica CBS 223.65]KDO20521.1 hypothetical protein SPRG_14279 [Saprolegnia parasitica CBS 223.65]|eukprot:XP_012208783.1 hypothetical protein SPRG_14279 [Saprolegnia parasitica CBS 223.65]
MDETLLSSLEARIAAICAATDLPRHLPELVHVCEELELQTLSSSVEPMAALHYAQFLGALLALRRLDEARHLWKRLPHKGADGLQQIWAVGRALWARDIVQAHAAAAALEASTTEPALAPVTAVLKQSIQHSTAVLIAQAYSVLSIDSTAQALGLSRDATLAFCAQHGWRIENDSVMPKALASHVDENAIELGQLHHLADYILHLEQRSIMKV